MTQIKKAHVLKNSFAVKNKLEQLKWAYAGLSGVCVAFFFSLLSSNVEITKSNCLFLSSICFAILLPAFVAFMLAHIFIVETDIEKEKAEKILNLKWVKSVTEIAKFLLFFAFVFLVFHFSKIMGICMFIVSIISCFLLKKFISEFTNNNISIK